MDINVVLKENGKLEASFNGLTVMSQSKVENQEYPEPFDYFLASTVLCAAFYIRAFLEGRKLSTDGLEVNQSIKSDPENKYKKLITLYIKKPNGFPEKYNKALMAAIKTCTVKKVVENDPEFFIELL